MLTLDDAFAKLISRSSIYLVIGVTDNDVKQVRYKLKHNTGVVTSELKRRWLRKAGYKPAHAEMWYSPGEALKKESSPEKYNVAEMIEFAEFFHRQSAAARQIPMYCLEKWMRK